MKHFSTVVISFAVGVILGVLVDFFSSIASLNAGPGFVKNLIKQKCFTAEQFSDGGICLPEQPFVAVVRNGDGSKDLIWGEENINRFLSSPTPQQEK